MTLEYRLELLLTSAVINRALTLRAARVERDGPALTPPVHTFMPVAVAELMDWREQVMAEFQKKT